jgi:hypothetical protein
MNLPNHRHYSKIERLESLNRFFRSCNDSQTDVTRISFALVEPSLGPDNHSVIPNSESRKFELFSARGLIRLSTLPASIGMQQRKGDPLGT